ncbi:GDP-L-fucose synthase [Prochlorococcus marinus XMU1410]|uniref:GDP-L-fucose synthase family protein n=1 Tax=Prochlorococcus marinus TaxID=1219 RepID=UPI001ADBA773|nr:GDP-L-fucose synthase [Prochlorococcus marinus]MBO8242363.1 GDP-L-fucose synthase [Prochlorococcus marinus XMU1410]MBW3053510.1 GDP-fucose synthetase [Prochlorococcus marinus str. MU1410]
MEKKILFNEKIFVAGSTGMAGSAICRSLVKNGYGRKNGGQILKPTRKELDLLNTNAVKQWFEINKPTVVIIAAAKVGGILGNSIYPTQFLLDNLKIQNNLIENSWKTGVKRLLFLGSSCIYPKFAQQPIKEESLLTSQLEETNQWYAIAKIAGIKLCDALRKQYNFDAISLMPTNLYGPGDNYHPQNSHVMASLIRKFNEAVKHKLPSVTCWGTGKPLREFLYVEDLGDAVVFALENWDPISNNAPKDSNNKNLTILNIGTGKDITIKELADKISNLVKYQGKIIWDKNKPDGTPRKLLDISKMKDLGWEPKISLDEGIKKSIESFKKENCF